MEQTGVVFDFFHQINDIGHHHHLRQRILPVQLWVVFGSKIGRAVRTHEATGPSSAASWKESRPLLCHESNDYTLLDTNMISG
jgi:hypothetical protein